MDLESPNTFACAVGIGKCFSFSVEKIDRVPEGGGSPLENLFSHAKVDGIGYVHIEEEFFVFEKEGVGFNGEERGLGERIEKPMLNRHPCCRGKKPKITIDPITALGSNVEKEISVNPIGKGVGITLSLAIEKVFCEGIVELGTKFS